MEDWRWEMGDGRWEMGDGSVGGMVHGVMGDVRVWNDLWGCGGTRVMGNRQGGWMSTKHACMGGWGITMGALDGRWEMGDGRWEMGDGRRVDGSVGA